MSHRDFHTTDHPAWVDRARELLDASARDLDATALSRLGRARQTALDLHRPHPARVWLLPAGLASACALLLVVGVWLPHRRGEPAQPSPVASTARAGDNDPLTRDASLEFYQDLEFYAWLDAQDKGGGS